METELEVPDVEIEVFDAELGEPDVRERDVLVELEGLKVVIEAELDAPVREVEGGNAVPVVFLLDELDAEVTDTDMLRDDELADAFVIEVGTLMETDMDGLAVADGALVDALAVLEESDGVAVMVALGEVAVPLAASALGAVVVVTLKKVVVMFKLVVCVAFGEAVTFRVGRLVGRAVVMGPVSVVFVTVVFVTVTLVTVVFAMVPLFIDVTLKRSISL